MRLLFVSGESSGGAPRSTIELAEQLARRSHGVTVLLRSERPPGGASAYERAVDVAVHASRFGAERFVRAALRPAGRRLACRRPEGAVQICVALRPENACTPLARRLRPDVVVASNLRRFAWRWLRDDLRRLGIPTVLYVREAAAIEQLTVGGTAPDLIVANAWAHAEALLAAGWECEVVPSVVDRSRAATTSTRRSALFVNPIRAHRPALIAALAGARPDIPFVLQESWPLAEDDRVALREVLALPNVELRAPLPSPADVFADARVLLAPYGSGRPRVVAEAQHNGIPVIAADQPALAEAVGPGGILVDLDDVAAWAEALSLAWDKPDLYDGLSRAAAEHDRRPEMNGELIAERFESLVARLVDRR